MIIADIVQNLEDAVLQSVDELVGCHDWAVFPRYVADNIEIDKSYVTTVCKELRNKGLLEFVQVFTEDMRVAGSGYQITPAGRTYLKRRMG